MVDLEIKERARSILRVIENLAKKFKILELSQVKNRESQMTRRPILYTVLYKLGAR